MSVGEKSVGVFLGFIGIEFRKGDPGMIVNCNEQDLPPGAAASISPIAGCAMARVFDPAKLFCVDMNQVARPFMFVALHWFDGIKVGQLG